MSISRLFASRKDARTSVVVVVVVLGLAALAHLVLVLGVRDTRGALDHDEVWSHLDATGHADDWPGAGDKYPAGAWVQGADMRKFLEVDSHSSFAETRRNLTDFDVHPPLFFWALLVSQKAGLGIIWSGPILNLIAVFVAGAILFRLLVELLDDSLLAASAIAVFAVTAALIRATAYARQYPFMMLAVVALIWVVTRLQQSPISPKYLVALFGIGVLGLLTDAVFVFALAGAVVVVTVRWFRNPRAVMSLLAVALASGLVALAVFPAYLDQASFAKAQGEASQSHALLTRVHDWVEGFFDYVTIDKPAQRILVPIIYLGFLVLVVTLPWWFRKAWSAIRTQPVACAALGVGGVALLGETAAYVLKRLPAHARGWQYIIVFWPSIVVLLALLVRNRPRAALTLLIIAALLGTYALQWQRLWHGNYAGQRRAVHEVSGATLVVADCLLRGYTPGAAMWVPRDARFFLGAPGTAPPPELPQDLDTSRAFLLHADGCRPVVNVDPVLQQLGLERGASIGPIHFVQVYRLEARTSR